MEKMYHIGLDDSHGARYAILPGDPGRVEKIAGYLDNPRLLGQNREYTTWIGELSGEKVLVMSTGMGGPSTQTYSGKTSSTFSIDVPADTPTKSGSTFLGWSESSTATSPTYTVGGGQIPMTTIGSTTTKVLYAVWSQEQITVSGTPSDLNTKAGSSWSYTPSLSVSGATITVSGAPWLSVVNGTVVGTPTASGTYEVTLTFEKSGYASGTQTFTINVVPALVFDSAPTGGVIAYAV